MKIVFFYISFLFAYSSGSFRYVNKATTVFDASSWRGNSGDGISADNKIRKTFILDGMNENVIFFSFQFTTIAQNPWPSGEIMLLTFLSFNTTYSSQLTSSSSETHTIVFALNQIKENSDTSGSFIFFDNIHQVTFEFSSSSSNAHYVIEPVYIGVYTRTEVATTICGPGLPTGAGNYPVFDTDESGFLWNFEEANLASETVYFEIDIPRNFYDFAVAFDDGHEKAWYDENRNFAINAILSNETFWRWTKYAESPCGSDTLSGYIPWTILNFEGGGGLRQLQEWNNGTHTFSDDSFYTFGGIAYLFAHEWVYTAAVGQYGNINRAWEMERTLQWRVPFVIQMQRTVSVEDIFDHTPTCAAMDVEFTWYANSTRDENILFSLLINQTIKLDDVCKNQCDTCHACNCTYETPDVSRPLAIESSCDSPQSLQELQIRVDDLTTEVVDLQMQVDDLKQTSDAVLTILEDYGINQQEKWTQAVRIGGLDCNFVPSHLCAGTGSCTLTASNQCELKGVV